ncbi:IS1381, transposase OrfA [Streptococcus pneumoniae]|nr:IS1381, transposase OrfA [Streptococcus pneumoniae]VPW88463.1 IS1381, transposase OrfA [Streptococcus pneumoniae]VQZ77609.1 IS1381, transposase OrfA [Streptococcus pneumoniae]
MDLKFEGVDLEYKKAKNNLPESFWETYSAFANTNGGKIILGIDEKNIDTYQRVNRLPAKQNYEASKQLTDTRFKRLVGVQRTTFEEMLAVLKTAYQLKHAKGGRKPKLSLEDLLMATLQYVREYRTYEESAAVFGIHESNLLRRSQWVEVTLVQSGVTISRTPLSSEDTVMIDATEVKINRPKKTISESFW